MKGKKRKAEEEEEVEEHSPDFCLFLKEGWGFCQQIIFTHT
jgi:hypothetical protein